LAPIGLSAVVTGWLSIERIIHPRTITDLGFVAAGGVIGFLGNEAVALYRTRLGRHTGSAVLLADGMHARADGLTSFTVRDAIGVNAG
jgi:divalent metal cation (Fe/Co/Zn/Cd) transporter